MFHVHVKWAMGLNILNVLITSPDWGILAASTLTSSTFIFHASLNRCEPIFVFYFHGWGRWDKIFMSIKTYFYWQMCKTNDLKRMRNVWGPHELNVNVYEYYHYLTITRDTLVPVFGIGTSSSTLLELVKFMSIPQNQYQLYACIILLNLLEKKWWRILFKSHKHLEGKKQKIGIGKRYNERKKKIGLEASLTFHERLGGNTLWVGQRTSAAGLCWRLLFHRLRTGAVWEAPHTLSRTVSIYAAVFTPFICRWFISSYYFPKPAVTLLIWVVTREMSVKLCQRLASQPHIRSVFLAVSLKGRIAFLLLTD